MESSARYALCIGLTNIPINDEWDVLIRLSKLLRKTFKLSLLNKIIKKLNQKEPYVILEVLDLLSIDQDEFNHLKNCIYKNEMDGCGSGGQSDAEVHVQNQYWNMAELDGNRP